MAMVEGGGMRSIGALRAEERARARDRMVATARRINSNRSVRTAARMGLVANGLVHILIGAIAVGIARGAGGSADQSGALSAIASTPFGLATLWFAGIALWGLALWQWTDAAWVTAPVRRTLIARRLKDFGKALGFAAVGTTTLVFAAVGPSNNTDTTHKISLYLLGTTAGVILLIVIGIVIASVGGGLIYRGVTRNFREDTTVLSGPVRVIVDVLGVIGLIAKGIALMVVGGLAIFAAIFTDPNQVGGLDGALKYLATLPSGSALLIAVAVGLESYGLYLLARATFLRTD
jgi:hypothetical protein